LYAEKYLNQCKISRVGTLYLTKRENSLISAYNKNLTADIDRICLSDEKSFSDNYGDINSGHEFYSNESFSFGGGNWNVEYDSGKAEISFRNNEMIVTNDKNLTVSALTVYYGINKKELYIGNSENTIKNNFVIKEKNGELYIRRL